MKISIRTTTLGIVTMAALALSGCSGGSMVSPVASTQSVSNGGPHTMSTGSSRTIQRRLNDFLSVQGTGGNGPVEFAFEAPLSTMPNCTSQGGSPLGEIDYAGVKDNLIVSMGGLSLHPVFKGSVSQTDNGDGTSTVSVDLNTTHAYAIAWCAIPNGIFGPFLGYTVTEITQYNEGPAAIGSSHLSIVFMIPGTGASTPLPDITTLNNTCANPPAPPPCIVSLKFNGAATGTLRPPYGVADGTPGTMSIIQINTFKVVGSAGRGDSGAVGITANSVTVLPTK